MNKKSSVLQKTKIAVIDTNVDLSHNVFNDYKISILDNNKYRINA